MTPPGEGLFEGTVASVLFTGSATELVVALDNGPAMRVRVPGGDRARRGDRLGIAVQPGCGVFVRADDRSSL